MNAKKPAKKAPAKAGVNEPVSLLRLLDSNLKGSERQILFGAVHERIRSQLLTHDEAALIAGWFQRLADGQAPARVFLGETRGRKRGSNTTEFLKGKDVAFPDHADLCWNIRRAIASTGDEDRIFKLFADHYGKTPDYLQRLYKQILPTLAADPELTNK